MVATDGFIARERKRYQDEKNLRERLRVLDMTPEQLAAEQARKAPDARTPAERAAGKEAADRFLAAEEARRVAEQEAARKLAADVRKLTIPNRGA